MKQNHISPGQDCTINPIVIDDSKRSAPEAKGNLEIFNSDYNTEDCICCPIRDIHDIPCGEPVLITKDMMKRSGCKGSFADAFEDVHP